VYHHWPLVKNMHTLYYAKINKMFTQKKSYHGEYERITMIRFDIVKAYGV
jgi:hypothetical protein